MDFKAAYEALSSIKKKIEKKNGSKASTDPKTNAIQKDILMIGETQYNYHQVIGHHELSQQIPRKPDGKKGSKVHCRCTCAGFYFKTTIGKPMDAKSVDAANPNKRRECPKIRMASPQSNI